MLLASAYQTSNAMPTRVRERARQRAFGRKHVGESALRKSAVGWTHTSERVCREVAERRVPHPRGERGARIARLVVGIPSR
eukprot:5719641-Pleurochrysis_carterae.AAC.1